MKLEVGAVVGRDWSEGGGAAQLYTPRVLPNYLTFPIGEPNKPLTRSTSESRSFDAGPKNPA